MGEWMFRSPRLVTIDSQFSSNPDFQPCILQDARLGDEFDGTSGVASSLCEGGRGFASEHSRSWRRVQSDSGASIIEGGTLDSLNNCGREPLFVNFE